MTNQYGSPSGDGFSPDYTNPTNASESLTNPFISAPGQFGYTHETASAYGQPTTPGYPQPTQYEQMNYSAVPTPMHQQPMMAYGQVPSGPVPYTKDKIIAALLCWFLGGFGAHNFYTGHSGAAIGQLGFTLSAVVWMWIPFLNFLLAPALVAWVVVNFIQILTSTGLYKYDFPR